MTESNALFDAGIYARDCIAFGKQFLQISGLEARGPRRVPAALRTTQQASLEERNRTLLRRSFSSVRLACEKQGSWRKVV